MRAFLVFAILLLSSGEVSFSAIEDPNSGPIIPKREIIFTNDGCAQAGTEERYRRAIEYFTDHLTIFHDETKQCLNNLLLVDRTENPSINDTPQIESFIGAPEVFFEKMSAPNPIKVYCHNRITGFGAVYDEIIVPENLSPSVTDEGLYAVLSHEYAHVVGYHHKRTWMSETYNEAIAHCMGLADYSIDTLRDNLNEGTTLARVSRRKILETYDQTDPQSSGNGMIWEPMPAHALDSCHDGHFAYMIGHGISGRPSLDRIQLFCHNGLPPPNNAGSYTASYDQAVRQATPCYNMADKITGITIGVNDAYQEPRLVEISCTTNGGAQYERSAYMVNDYRPSKTLRRDCPQGMAINGFELEIQENRVKDIKFTCRKTNDRQLALGQPQFLSPIGTPAVIHNEHMDICPGEMLGLRLTASKDLSITENNAIDLLAMQCFTPVRKAFPSGDEIRIGRTYAAINHSVPWQYNTDLHGVRCDWHFEALVGIQVIVDGTAGIKGIRGVCAEVNEWGDAQGYPSPNKVVTRTIGKQAGTVQSSICQRGAYVAGLKTGIHYPTVYWDYKTPKGFVAQVEVACKPIALAQ